MEKAPEGMHLAAEVTITVTGVEKMAKLIKISDGCWVDPNRVIAVSHGGNGEKGYGVLIKMSDDRIINGPFVASESGVDTFAKLITDAQL